MRASRRMRGDTAANSGLQRFGKAYVHKVRPCPTGLGWESPRQRCHAGPAVKPSQGYLGASERCLDAPHAMTVAVHDK